jgi:hypothetical protein
MTDTEPPMRRLLEAVADLADQRARDDSRRKPRVRLVIEDARELFADPACKALLTRIAETGRSERVELELHAGAGIGTATVLAGCHWCQRLIARASGSSDEWRILPDKIRGTGPVLRGEAALACSASPDDRHHPPDPELGQAGNPGALRHLGAM